MSRKDYVKFAALFAGELALCPDKESFTRMAAVVHSSADIFKQDNPNFDRDRFYTACGLI